MSILSAEIKSAEAELSKIPYEKLRKFDFWSQPGMSNNQQVIYGMAQDTVQYVSIISIYDGLRVNLNDD